jgi:hypothetical protein
MVEYDLDDDVLCVDVPHIIDQLKTIDIVYCLLRDQITLAIDHRDAPEMEYATMALTVAVYKIDTQKMNFQEIWSWKPEEFPRDGDAYFDDADGAFSCLDDIHGIYNEFLVEVAKNRLPIMENVRIAVGLRWTLED